MSPPAALTNPEFPPQSRRPRDLIPGRGTRLLATFFGSGLSPIMPGTVASFLAALPLLLLPAVLYPWTLTLAALGATLVSAHIARRFPPAPGPNKPHDPRWFVLDEAAGMWVAAFGLEAAAWPRVLVAFVAFRVFDVLKPPPLRALERVGAGYGIVLDDLGAGVYALAVSMALAPVISS